MFGRDLQAVWAFESEALLGSLEVFEFAGRRENAGFERRDGGVVGFDRGIESAADFAEVAGEDGEAFVEFASGVGNAAGIFGEGFLALRRGCRFTGAVLLGETLHRVRGPLELLGGFARTLRRRLLLAGLLLSVLCGGAWRPGRLLAALAALGAVTPLWLLLPQITDVLPPSATMSNSPTPPGW